ncbi:hypothetical protein [Streptomyces murinus]
MGGEDLVGDSGGEQRGGLLVGVPGGEGAEVLCGLTFTTPPPHPKSVR